MKSNNNGIDWEDVKKELYSKQKIKEYNVEANFLSNLIELRNDNKITQ